MKLQYKLSLVFAFLILIAGAMLIILNSELVRGELEKNLVAREKIGLEILEKKIFPYAADKDYASVTALIFEEKEIKKGFVEYIVVHGIDNKITAHTFLTGVPEEMRQSQEEPDDAFSTKELNMGNQPIIEATMPLKDGTYVAGYLHVGYKKEYIENILARLNLMSSIAVALITASIIVSGVFLFRRMIAQPIGELASGIDSISAGNLDVKVKLRTGDEFERMAGAFNKMASDIKESKAKIETFNKTLKEEVAEKTKELNQKVDELTTTKNAVLNMMDDTEELNKSLTEARDKLSESVDELKETDIKKNEFMSIAAHELKTPMTSIHGFSQLLQDKKVADDPEKRDKYLKIMDHETTRLAKLVNDVLDLSRIDLNAMNFDFSEVDINDVIDTVRTEMDVQIKAKGLESEYIIDKNLPKITTDRERLTQILMNLINNSVKYTQKGKITVKISREDGILHFIVKDTGIGIARKNQEKIFTRFYQVDSSYTRSVGGVGLGLSLCKELVDLLGGKIWFESVHEKGSEFHFTLPAKGSLKRGIQKIAEK
ncbi:ATP-binding protein [archaeon]|nr:HAMP domain-containing protein [Nanoarchaeota archaeon]MBU4452557.1 HAMP domain-containing protein [Nanoarchaeota archaeon]MCG2723522.1 ATP-binding protein [archaeon]